MVKSPFPDYIGFSVKTKDNLGDYKLTVQEANVLSARACEKRIDEFTLGRAACFSALKQVGFSHPPPVLKGELNEPIWPYRFAGSITHTREVAICAIGPYSRTMGIGIDLEELEGIENKIPEKAYDVVCTAPELEWIASDPALAEVRVKRVFSAKEAAFKAFFPHAMAFLDFTDAVLKWNSEKGCFAGKLLIPIGDTFSKGYRFEVYSRIIRTLVFSYILLPSQV